MTSEPIHDLWRAALEYASLGIRVLPLYGIADGRCQCSDPDCESPGKHPRINGWRELASADARQVTAWWGEWPEANIGALVERDTVVLDVDMHSTDGLGTLQLVQARYGTLPDTPLVQSGGGGLHFYFAGEGPSAKIPGYEGIERRGFGGYMVMPPSLHASGELYLWACGRELKEMPKAPAPEWLLHLHNPPTLSGQFSWDEGDPILEGRRDDTIFRIGLRLLRQGQTGAQMLKELHRINSAYCKPPLPNSVIEQKAEQAEKYMPAATEEDDNSLSRLASLSKFDYDRVRKQEAESMGIRVATLDEEVDKRRPSLGSEDGKQGRKVELHEFEPWPTQVDGAELLDELVGAIADYVVLPVNGPETAALWILHVFAFDCWENSPRLGITSPEKRCGKSRLLDVLGLVCPRAKRADSISSAAIFRIIEMYRPCLLIDEADTFLKDNEDLRGILNSSHARNGCVTRCVGDAHEPKDFSTWAPIAIACIRALPETVADRSIILQLQRKTQKQHVKRFRGREVRDRFEILGRKAARWVSDNESLLVIDPAVPDALNDREADNWLPLLAIACAAGGPWPERAKRVALAKGQDVTESHSSTLLEDIRDIIAESDDDSIFSQGLCDKLAGLEERPWATWNQGKPLDQTRLSSLLKPYGICSKNVRIDGAQRRGYEFAKFEGAFERYASDKGCLSATLQDTAVPLSQATDANNGEQCRTSMVGTPGHLEQPISNPTCPNDLYDDAEQRTIADDNQSLGTVGWPDTENPQVQDPIGYVRRNESGGIEV